MAFRRWAALIKLSRKTGLFSRSHKIEINIKYFARKKARCLVAVVVVAVVWCVRGTVWAVACGRRYAIPDETQPEVLKIDVQFFSYLLTISSLFLPSSATMPP